MSMDLTGIPFGELLGQFRTRSRMSQQKLANELHVHRNTVSAWENGNIRPQHRDTVVQLARLLRLNEQETTALFKAAQLEQPTEIWHVPYQRNMFFTGREETLQNLRRILAAGKTAALTQPQAISGLGGVGKTQTAIEYVYRYRHDYHTILWLRADSPETLLTELVNIARILNLPEKDEQDQNRITHAVKRWLKIHREWLLVLDNVEDAQLVEELLPTGHQGCVLLTTRSQVTEPFAQASELEKMTAEEGVTFLLRRTKIIELEASLKQAPETVQIEAEKVWKEMDGLPLALDQAGAYILETKCGLLKYIDLYHRQRTKLLNRRGKATSDHPEPVTTTFSLSFEKVQYVNPAAAELLQLCAFLDPDAIPEEILQVETLELSPVLQSLAKDPMLLDDAIGELGKYSLIKRNADIHMLSIHHLVQAVLQDSLSRDEQRVWSERTVRILHKVFPSIDATINITSTAPRK